MFSLQTVSVKRINSTTILMDWSIHGSDPIF
jgi:hypothetical protein